jgi:DNA repair exonuclease SbcCD ATPase subunit
MAQKDRKDLLAQFLDINIFEDLYSIANADIKEVATLIKEYQRQDFSTQLANANTDIEIYTLEHKNHQLDKKELEDNISNINEQILTLTSNLVPVDNSITNIDRLTELRDQAISFLTQLEQNEMKKLTELKDCKTSLSELQENIKLFNINEIQARIDVLDGLHNTEKNLHGNVEKLKAEVGHKLDKMKKLDDLKYDENCSFCMDNVFVKDAIATKASIEEDKKHAQKIIDDLQSIKDKITQLKPSIQEKEDFNKLNQDIHKTESLKSSIESELHQIKSKYHQGTSRLGEVDTKIAEYYKQENVIKENEVINGQIDSLNIEVSDLKDELSNLNDLILTCYSNILVAENIKTKTEESIEKLKELTQQYKYYQYYLEAVNRDGVPYDLITTAVPYIEQEINNILSQLVEFNLMLEMDGKNINCYIVYDQDNFWPIELTSGMEKFVSSLAIRTALINVSSLPRPNFLAIDEGFGVLDSENLNSMFNLFEYLKTQFSFMLVISHIDSMRDVVDKLIEITKTNGASKIYYI